MLIRPGFGLIYSGVLLMMQSKIKVEAVSNQTSIHVRRCCSQPHSRCLAVVVTHYYIKLLSICAVNFRVQLIWYTDKMVNMK